MDPDKRLGIPEHVISRYTGGETVILDLNSGTYFGLDPVGARVWQLLTDGCRIPDVVTTMLEEFDVAEDQLRQDVTELVDELVARGLAQIQS